MNIHLPGTNTILYLVEGNEKDQPQTQLHGSTDLSFLI